MKVISVFKNLKRTRWGSIERIFKYRNIIKYIKLQYIFRKCTNSTRRFVLKSEKVVENFEKIVVDTKVRYTELKRRNNVKRIVHSIEKKKCLLYDSETGISLGAVTNRKR